jgi:nitrogen fixation NifU-like protein
MMSEAIKGRTISEIRETAGKFKAMLTDGHGIPESDTPGSYLGDLEALQGVKNYPVRIKCASLPWATLEDALEQ